MPETRLIERWLPISALGEESVRERRSMTALPPIYYLHVWWARRPLVASRAAVLASLLPADADRERFLHVIGIHGDPVATRRRIDAARRAGERFEGQAYSYPRAFSYFPDREDRRWLQGVLDRAPGEITILDPTAGGGSIPTEAMVLGARTIANDLNPVSALILRGTIQWPAIHRDDLQQEFKDLAKRFVEGREERQKPYFPREPIENTIPTNYLWSRTVICPYCDGLVPLSPNWRVASDGTGIRVEPRLGGASGKVGRVCSFEIATSASKQSSGTVARGNGICPYPDCGRVIDGDEIKRQAQAGRMGDQLYAVVYKERVQATTKSGRIREKWVRRYRAPRPEDDNAAEIEAKLAEKLPEWEAFDIVPSERFPAESNDDRPIQYGMPLWRDLFSPPASLSRRQRRSLPRDARRRSDGGQARRASQGCLRVSGALSGQVSELQLSHVRVDVNSRSGCEHVQSSRFRVLLVARRNGAADHGPRLRLGHRADRQVHRRARRPGPPG